MENSAMTIPFSKVWFTEEEYAASRKVDESGWLACGPETEAFEREFADYVGVKYAIFTNSCTSALKMAYKWASEVHGVDWIDYPQNTFCATYSAAVEMGLLASYYGEPIHPPKSKIMGNFRVNMHYGGVKDETPCLIEDSAHRIEANDPLVGKIRCYSFYATKNMTTRQGGMLVTNDNAIYERCRLYWRDGLSTSTADRLSGTQGYRVEVAAGGYDGNDNAAAIGRVQLRRLPQFTKRRNDIRDIYNDALGANWQGNHLYPYFVEDEDAVYKTIAWMKDKGIHCGHHYPGTGWNGVSLPIYPLLTDLELDYIISNINQNART